jgi:hypothetical protein
LQQVGSGFIADRQGELVEPVQRSSSEAPTPMPALQRSGCHVVPNCAFFDEENPLRDVKNVGWVIQRFELSFNNPERLFRRIRSHSHFSDGEVSFRKRRGSIQDLFDHNGPLTFPVIGLSFGETLWILVLLGMLHSPDEGFLQRLRVGFYLFFFDS